MKRTFFLLALAGALLLSAALVLSMPKGSQIASLAPGTKDDLAIGKLNGSAEKAHVVESSVKLPLYFCPNHGQLDQQVKFYACGRSGTFFFTTEGVAFSLEKPVAKAANKEVLSQGSAENGRRGRTLVGLRPLGMQPEAEVVATDPQPGKIHYFIGHDPRKWQKNIPTYKAVIYREAYPGIDLKFYGNNRRLEYDLIVKPGADPAQVIFQYWGIKSLSLTQTGELAITLPDGGKLTQKKPIVYQEIDGRRVPREAKFRVHQEVSHFAYAFDVGAYDSRYPLVIDPTLEYFTYLGGDNFDWGNGIAVDANGSVYVTGQTYSAQFPVFPANNKIFPSGSTATSAVFVTKLDPTLSGLVYSTMLGGNNDNFGAAIAVDAVGNAYVTGATEAKTVVDSTAVRAKKPAPPPPPNFVPPDFPITPGVYQVNYGGGYWDAFVLKLKDSGDLEYSTYLGGGDLDVGRGIAVYTDTQGNTWVYVTGKTFSSNFPTAGPASAYKGNGDAFVAKLDGTLSNLSFSRYLGGKGDDAGNGIAADGAGKVYVTGYTASSDFLPIVNALRPKNSGSYDAFVTKLDSDGTVLYSTFLGGNNYDTGEAIAADADGAAYITGYTYSSNFPVTPGATQTAKAGGTKTADAFVTKLNSNGGLAYSTYLGGSNTDYASGIAVDSSKRAYITGGTVSSDFPTTQVLGTTRGGWDVFVTRLNSGGARDYSIILGGSGDEEAYAIAVDGSGAAYVTGYSSSSGLGTSGAYQPQLYPNDPNPNPYDAFVAKIQP